MDYKLRVIVEKVAAILIWKIQLMLGGMSRSNPWSMKVSKCSQLLKYR